MHIPGLMKHFSFNLLGEQSEQSFKQIVNFLGWGKGKCRIELCKTTPVDNQEAVQTEQHRYRGLRAEFKKYCQLPGWVKRK